MLDGENRLAVVLATNADEGRDDPIRFRFWGTVGIADARENRFHSEGFDVEIESAEGNCFFDLIGCGNRAENVRVYGGSGNGDGSNDRGNVSGGSREDKRRFDLFGFD